MTPQMQQAIKLLQLSTLDLQQEIQEALDSNPMLEVNEEEASGQQNEQEANASTEDKPSDSHPAESTENTENTEASPSADTGSDFEAEDNQWSEEIPSDLPVDTSWEDVYQTPLSGTPANDSEEMDFDTRRSVTESLHDHLLWQLNLTPMSDQDRVIAMAIIDAIEPAGLLTQTPEEIYQGLSAGIEELELDEVIAVLHRIQQFDPPGIAGQDLADCLLIQLNQFAPETPYLTAAKMVVQDYLSLLGSKDYKQLMRKTRLKEPELREVIQLIQTLNPKPGNQIDSGDTEYIVPDVFVTKDNDRWTVKLNPEIAPRIRINPNYASLVKRADTSEDNTFLRDNLQEARWFLKSLQSRNETLLKVASCIVEKQQGFLDHGEEAMKPLVLHDVAEDVGMHESTISRVTTQKYMHTPQGILELKYFFSSHVSTDSGGECSSTAIRAIIKKLVAAENPKKPLSDSKITTLLAEKGIKVARRTIAKYRESLSIPASNERKQLV